MQINCVTTGNRLSNSDYKKPKVTITDNLQDPKQIEEKLKNYVELESEELEDVVIGSHLRYITYSKKTNSERFCTGGVLRVKNSTYIILAGKDNLTFSVQRYFKDNDGKIIYKTRFFRKLKPTEILKEDLNETVAKSDDVFKKQNKVINQQQAEIDNLKKMLAKSKLH